MRPVLYLDVDDVLVNWAGYQRRPARGARELLLWARDHFEIRWLTRRCPDGEMPDWCVAELVGLLGVEVDLLARVRGLDWADSASKVNGIAWLEHLVLGRPFVWLDDEHGAGDFELAVLTEQNLAASCMRCNVSMDPDALLRAFRELAGDVADVGTAEIAADEVAAGDVAAATAAEQTFAAEPAADATDAIDAADAAARPDDVVPPAQP